MFMLASVSGRLCGRSGGARRDGRPRAQAEGHTSGVVGVTRARANSGAGGEASGGGNARRFDAARCLRSVDRCQSWGPRSQWVAPSMARPLGQRRGTARALPDSLEPASRTFVWSMRRGSRPSRAPSPGVAISLNSARLTLIRCAARNGRGYRLIRGEADGNADHRRNVPDPLGATSEAPIRLPSRNHHRWTQWLNASLDYQSPWELPLRLGN
jgi:hypothetical protein